MAPRLRLACKRSAREHEVARANARLQRRRSALRTLQAVAARLELPLPVIDSRRPDAGVLKQVLRTLARRCTAGAEAEDFDTAVRAWVSNGGVLPDGLVLCDRGQGLAAEDDEAPAVPRHKVLKAEFRLQSSAFMLTYHNAALTAESWPPFRAFMQKLAQTHGARAWAACLEENGGPGGAEAAAQRFHAHGYLLWTDGIGLRLRDVQPLRFLGKHPRIDVCTARGAGGGGAASRAALHGLWYVYVKKAGTREAASNHRPWRDYTPSAWWLTALWDAHKLSHEAFLTLSASFRSGHAKRKRDAEAVMRQEKEASVAAHATAEATAASRTEPLQRLRDFPEVADFVSGFTAAKRRRPILAIVGGTNCGKSLLAQDILERVGKVLGVPSYEEVTVEGDTVLDFSSFDHRIHAGILFDGLGDAQTLWTHREVLQGRPKVARGGRSATMMYSFPYTLARRAVVATMDLTAKNLHLFRTNHWMSNAKNVVCLRLESPAWQVRLVHHPRDTEAEAMAAWSVEELARRVASEDAEALSQTLRANGVNGSDFLAFEDAAEAARDLKLSPFAAKKLIRLRETFLRAREQ